MLSKRTILEGLRCEETKEVVVMRPIRARLSMTTENIDRFANRKRKFETRVQIGIGASVKHVGEKPSEREFDDLTVNIRNALYGEVLRSLHFINYAIETGQLEDAQSLILDLKKAIEND